MEKYLFLPIYFLLFFSISGWGILSIKFFKIQNENFSISLIIGLIFLTFLSYTTTFFFKHNEFFNLFIIFIGIFIYLINKRKYKISKTFFLIIIIISISLLISKNHDDFPFYHLQQSLNLSLNKFQIGLSNVDFPFAHHSSLLFLNSLFYLPYYKFYLFNAPNLIIFTSVVLFLFDQIQGILKYKKNFKDLNCLFSFYFLSFSISYILIKFSRLSEFGTDLAAQCLILVLVYLFINKKKIKENIYLIHLILLFCITVKTYFILYFLFFLYLIYFLKIEKYFLFIKDNKIFFSFLIFFSFEFFLINFLTTGCLIYPISSLCFDNFSWAMSSEEVQNYNEWYEKWAKGIAGTGYVLENSSKYLNNFNWISNWFNNYFKNKFIDNLGLWVFLSFIFIFSFSNKLKSKSYYSKNLLIIFSIILLIIIFWFSKHPTLRYGGYAPLTAFFAILVSYYLTSYKVNIFKIKKNIKIIIFFSLIIFFTKNIIRIYSEFKRNDEYKFVNFPYFYIPKVESKKIVLNSKVTIYEAINNNCWNINPPCTTNANKLKVKKYRSYIIFFK